MKRTLLDVAIVVGLAVAIYVAPDIHTPATATAGETRASLVLVQGKSVYWWSRRAVQARKDANARGRTIRRLQKVIRHNVTITDAIELAATAYQVDAAMLERKASCESTGGHGYDPHAVGKPIADGEKPLGLFQFIPSTWASTPFAGFSPFDPLAAALAAGWMHANGRGGEWQCR